MKYSRIYGKQESDRESPSYDYHILPECDEKIVNCLKEKLRTIKNEYEAELIKHQDPLHENLKPIINTGYEYYRQLDAHSSSTTDVHYLLGDALVELYNYRLQQELLTRKYAPSVPAEEVEHLLSSKRAIRL